jgi:hypothetical protein
MNKTNLVLIIFVVGVVLFLQAGCSSVGPTITFENAVLDFGKVRPRANNIGEFKFTNTGKDLLKITKVERCCGVVTKLERTEYGPDQSGVLKVTFQAASTPSVMNRTIYVNSNDKNNPRVALNIKAEVVMNVSWEPKTISLSPDFENAECPEITIKSVDGKKIFSISRFISTGNCITADINPSVQATEFVLKPKVDISKLTKYSRGGISISLVYAEPNEPPDTVPIVFRTTERFTVAPRSLFVFYSEPQNPVIRTLTITRNYGEDFEVESVSSKDGHVKVLGREAIENGYKYELEITPTPVNDRGRFSDTLTITLKDGQKIEVFCRGILSVPDEKAEKGKEDEKIIRP